MNNDVVKATPAIGTLFAVRHKDGFYYPNYNVDGTQSPRLYSKIGHARAAITSRSTLGTWPRNGRNAVDYEIVEYSLTEVRVSKWEPPLGDNA